MNLIDEENDVAACADLLQNLLQSLFEITAVARAGDKCAEVERVELLALQSLWDIAFYNRLR